MMSLGDPLTDSCTKYEARPGPAFLQDAGLRLLFFGGKGGVGKTVCAAATALSLAQRHPERPFLLVSTDPAHSLADCLDSAPPFTNLTLNELDPQECLGRFKLRHEASLRSIALRGTFLDEADIAQLLDLSMPGLDEVMALLEIAGWVKQGHYACIVVDTAPAGHTLRLLNLPETMQRWVATLDAMLAKHRFLVRHYQGAYHKEALDQYLEQTLADLTGLDALLQSPEQCRFVPVLLAETLSIHVTGILLGELERLELPVQELIVNRLRLAQAGCPACTAIAAQQSVAIDELNRVFSGYCVWGLPLFPEELRGVSRLMEMWPHARPLAQVRRAVEDSSTSMDNMGRNTPAAPCPMVESPAPLPAPTTKLILFAGKGGVGKTTLSCASALHLAEIWGGKEILLFSIDPAHSLAACLGYTAGPGAIRVAPGLSVIEFDAQAEFERLKQAYANELMSVFNRTSDQEGIAIAFDREVMERILDLAPPGLDEVLAITHIMDIMERRQYDLFILDTAPTGHLLRFLEMPGLVEQWLKAFFALFLKYRDIFWLPKISQMMVDLSRQIKAFQRILLDTGQSMLVAVTIPTEMARLETRDLVAACARLGVSVPAVWVNLVTPPTVCPVCSRLRQAEEAVLVEYKTEFADRICVKIFRQPAEVRGIDQLRALGQSLYV